MCKLRKAKESEELILTDIAYRSEAYWGFDNDYMSKFAKLYCVSKEFIRQNPTIVLEKEDRIIGFYGIKSDDIETSLEYFYIEPKYIGHGYGKKLWSHLQEHCKELGIKELHFVTSPEAKDFYIKMGAVESGEVESLLKEGRIIPQLIYQL